MKQLETPTIRTIVAIVVGVPGTLTLGLLAIFLIGISAFGIPMAAVEAMGGYKRLDFIAESFVLNLLNLAWGIAGVSGIAAFWAWALSGRPLPRRKALTICIGLALGVAAVVPVLLTFPEGWLWRLAVLGATSAVLRVLHLCLLTTRSSGP